MNTKKETSEPESARAPPAQHTMTYNYFYIALGVVFVASIVEGLILTRFNKFDWRSFSVTAANVAIRGFVVVAIPFSIADPLFPLISEHALFKIPLEGWQAFLILFVGQDFCYYWYHRSAHRIRWFWTAHSIHHSANDFNYSVAYRSSAFSMLTGNSLFFLPLVWIGFPAKIAVATLGFNVLYQFWLHVTWLPKLGWLEYVLNTPSAHRVHHSRNVEYLDSNYGGVLIIFDRLFGTYKEEIESVPCEYGLVFRQRSYNPFRVEFDPWIELGKDLISARKIREFLGYLICPPGWKPEGSGATVEELRQKAHSVVRR